MPSFASRGGNVFNTYSIYALLLQYYGIPGITHDDAHSGTIVEGDFLRNKGGHTQNCGTETSLSRYFHRLMHRPALALSPLMGKLGSKILQERVPYI